MGSFFLKIIFLRQTKEYVASIISAPPAISDLFIYCLYLELIGVRWKKAISTNLDVFIWFWVQYFRVSDAVLDYFSHKIEIDDVEKMLNEAEKKCRFPYISKAYLTKIGVTNEDLFSIHSHLLDYGSKKKSVDLIENFAINYQCLLDNLTLSNEKEKNIIKEIFIDASITMLKSHLLEKRYGPFADLEKARQVFNLKTSDYANILSKGHTQFCCDKKHSNDVKSFVISTLVFGQLIDDVIDLSRDFGTQINIFISTSATYFPKEFVRIKNLIDTHHSRNNISLLTLILYAPRTLIFVLVLILNSFFRMFIKRPLSSLLILIGVICLISKKLFKNENTKNNIYHYK